MIDTEIIRYEFDEFCLDVIDQKLLKDNKEITLTHKAFQTLLILVQNSGQTVEKDQIFEQLWADSFVEEANLTQYIYLLRKVLDQKEDRHSYIETLNKLGYRFNADVKKIRGIGELQEGKFSAFTQSNSNEFQEQVEHIEPEYSNQINNQTVDDSRTGKFDKSGNFIHLYKRAAIGLFGLLVICLSIAGFFYVYENLKYERQSNENKVKSIAILPFKSIGADSKNEKLGLGMSDAIITRLSKLQQIPVLPTSSVFSYADQSDVNPIIAGNELGVDVILSGTVQREGERIRITVQLVDVTDGKPLWAEKFDETYTGIFEVQDSISLKVAQSLAANLTDNQKELLTKRPTENVEASQAYQFGVYFWNKRTKEDLEKAVEYFSRAIELDPNYAQAYAMLADSYNMLGFYRYADPKEMLKIARQNAEKSLALNSSLPEGYIALAFVQSYESGREEAKISLEKAIELSPYNSTAHTRYGWLLLFSKDLDSAVREMRLAQRYDPLSPVSNGAFCTTLLYQQDFKEAVKFCEKSIDLAPNNALVRINLAESYFFAGRYEEAISQANKQIKSGVQSNYALATLGFFYAKLDRRAEAIEIISKLEAEAEKDSYLLPGLITISYALGNTDEALVYFNKALEKKVLSSTSFYYDPVWKEIRSDTRFRKVLEQFLSES